LAPLPSLEILSWIFLGISLVLLIVLLVGLFRFVRDVRSGRRARVDRPSRRSLVRAVPWVLALLFGWYTLYSPLPIYLPGWYPDLWPTTGTGVLMGTLTVGIAFRVASAFFPRGRDRATSLADPSPPSSLVRDETKQPHPRPLELGGETDRRGRDPERMTALRRWSFSNHTSHLVQGDTGF
jgi:hypothetical protein